MICYGILWGGQLILVNFLFIACVAGGIISVRESFGGGAVIQKRE